MIQFPNIEDLADDESMADEAGVHYHYEDIPFAIDEGEKVATWIKASIEAENKEMFGVSYIFCSDEYLHKINIEYLQHDDYTDVITFPYNENPITGDVFISVERLTENALLQKVSFKDELHRVMIHGALHLCGYSDKTPELRAAMTEKENFYLAKR
jgi:probable rRNA maturation factor